MKRQKTNKTIIKIGGLRFTLPIILILLVLLIAASSFLIPSIRDALGIGSWPKAFQDLLPEELMGYNETEISETILGKTQDKGELVVMEQEVSVTIQLTRALWNIPLFEKTKTVYSHGVGGFSVDLSLITEGALTWDSSTKSMTLVIPQASLSYIDPDFSKTEFGNTEKALLAFGDIKLTQEQQNVLNVEIEEAMEEALNVETRLRVANIKAKQKVGELLRPLVEELNEGIKLYVIQE
ncbi:MAG: DUF4230 domain-containing protein [Anaerovoracaceae bacterium]|jgi:hypothetical protein|nr:DUF4230 domain-containing protein [Anaerovoracaceae bacterium]